MPEPARLDPAFDEPLETPPAPRLRILAIVASLLIPGAGQIALGDWGRGVLWYLALPVAMIASPFTPWPSIVVIADILAGLIVRVASAVDAAFPRLAATRPGWRRVLALWLLMALGAGGWMNAWQRFYSYRVSTNVMADTLIVGDSILIDSRAYKSREPRRGELVSVDDRFRWVMLRVAAVGGDTVQMQHHRVLVSGRLVDEPYRKARAAPPGPSKPCEYLFGCQPLEVPPGLFFVLGDTRDIGQDSRYWGLIPRENISGKPIVIYWSAEPPPKRSDRLNLRLPSWGRLGTWLR